MIKINGKDAVYKKYKFSDERPGFGRVDIHMIQIYVINGDRSYDIRCSAFDSLMDIYAPTFEQMLKTLVFKEPIL